MIEFISEVEASGQVSASASPMIFISGRKSNFFDVSELLLATVLDSSCKVLFKTKADHESFSGLDQRWGLGNFNYLNHVGRHDDDAIYGYCQALCQRLCSIIQPQPELYNDFNVMMESIAYAAADAYTVLLRTGIMILESVRSNQNDLVVIMGPNLQLSVAISFMLAVNGVKSKIIPPSRIGKKGLDAQSEAFIGFNVGHFVRIPKSNADIADTAKSLKLKLSKVDAVGVFRSKDPVYLQNIDCVVRGLEEKFLLIDRFVDEKVEESLRSVGDKVELYCLTSDIYFMSERDSKLLRKSVLSRRHDLRATVIDFGSHKIHESFVLFGLSALVGCIVRAIFYYRVFKEAFSGCKVSYLMVSPSRSLEARAITEVAKLYRISSFELQCGTITSSRRFWRPNCDYVLCSDPVSENIYKNFFGLGGESVALVGSPRLDRNISSLREVARNSHSDALRCLIALQTVSVEVSAKMIEVCYEALQEIPLSKLTVAFHPRESEYGKAYLRAKIVGLSREISVVESDTLSHMAQHDVCVTYFSFLAIEAYGMGREVVALNVTEDSWPFRLSELGVAREATSSIELSDIFKDIYGMKGDPCETRLCDSEQDPSFVLKDGRSIERIMSCVNTYKPRHLTANASPVPEATLRSLFKAIFSLFGLRR